MATPSRHLSAQRGFTLVEIMVVVTLIGLLCAIAAPAYQRLVKRTKLTSIRNDLRAASGAIQIYSFERGAWPPDGVGGWPTDLIGYLPPPDRWNQVTPIGGTWAWALDTDGTKAALRINNFTLPLAQMTDLDALVDDGDTTTGELFINGASLIYAIEK